MTISFAAAIYFIVWWIVLFAVLPFGITSQTEEEKVAGGDPGAPAAPLLVKKALVTSLIAAAITALIFAASQLIEL